VKRGSGEENSCHLSNDCDWVAFLCVCMLRVLQICSRADHV
jgi:hypothetical protein